MNAPFITADLHKLRHNAETLAAHCHAHGVSLAAVTKCVSADERITAVLADSADMLADSRTQNLHKLPMDKPRLLLRVPMLSETAEAVAVSEMSLQSEIDTIRRFGQEAARQGKQHRVILMIDLGDLREGILFSDSLGIERAARAVLAEPALTLYGLGTNLTCFGGILADEENLGRLVDIAAGLRRQFDTALPLVSGGNSSSIGLMLAGGLPQGVNHLRLGEAILLGNDTAACTALPGLYGDAFCLSAELVEIQKKPSLPIGVSGANAFGEPVHFEDEGEQLRGILAIGRQDTNAEGLRPLDKDICILGASSDHLIVNLGQSKTEYRVGDILSFVPDYGALLKAYTSPYVSKAYQ